VYTYNGKTWSKPDRIDPPTTTNSAPRIYSVSCPSPSFCVATDIMGNLFTYDGQSWSGATNLDSTGVVGPDSCGLSCPGLSVSCFSPSFCVVVGIDGHVFVYNGKKWSGPKSLPNSVLLTGVACPSPKFCVAISKGYVNTLEGIFTYSRKWSSLNQIDGGRLLNSVSCPSTRFCVGVDETQSVLYQHRSWSTQGTLDGYNQGNGLDSLSCPSVTFCVAGDIAGNVTTYDPTTFTISQQEPIDTQSDLNVYLRVSCPTPTFCAAADFFGNVFIGTPPTSQIRRVGPMGRR